MNEGLLEEIEHEVLGWPGVWKKRDEDGPGGIGVTGYRFGRARIGHVHDDGHADFRFPREVRDDLIQSAEPPFTRPSQTAERRRATDSESRKTFRALWTSSA